MMKNFIRIIIITILCCGCVYPRYLRGPNKTGYDYFALQDSVDMSVSYMEGFANISEKHLGSSISIKTFVELDPHTISKLPIEVYFKKKDKKHYSETQKVWIPSFIIKQGGKEYVTKGFWSVYPNNLRP
jgi:hypothetical protein